MVHYESGVAIEVSPTSPKYDGGARASFYLMSNHFSHKSPELMPKNEVPVLYSCFYSKS
jgi:hypothetical protein